MAGTLITLTTDFGLGSPYVAAMKGSLLSVAPAARIVPSSQSVPPQVCASAGFSRGAALPYFPAGTLHVIVVDPGVGTDRAMLCVEVGGHVLLVPDNGCWTEAARRLGATPAVVRL